MSGPNRQWHLGDHGPTAWDHRDRGHPQATVPAKRHPPGVQRHWPAAGAYGRESRLRAQVVDCPTCKAVVGQPCTTWGGDEADYPHTSRAYAAKAARKAT